MHPLLLMTEFYRNLPLQSGKTQALRHAMLTPLKDYPNPIGWAALTLVGEP